MIYGYNVDQFKDDHLVEAIEKAMNEFGQASVPGTFMVDIFPWSEQIGHEKKTSGIADRV